MAMAALLVCPSSSQGQGQIRMTIHLGSANELAIDAVYHDPAEVDQRLNGTRIIPMWLSVKNNSSRPVPLAYQDMRLDLGSAASTTQLSPIEGNAARAILRRDGHYNAVLRFLSSQGNDYTPSRFPECFRVVRSGRGKRRADTCSSCARRMCRLPASWRSERLHTKLRC